MNKQTLKIMLCTLALISCSCTRTFAEAVTKETAKPDKIKPPHLIMAPGPVIPKTPTIVPTTKNIEITFVVDTTGSMGGLIQGAKTKIWNIVNEVMQYQKKGTKVKVGLVAYRDRGDAYVVKTTELSENLDKIYADLMGFKAQGGGDEPEDVRQALAAGLSSIQWGKTNKNLTKIIFLVGDAKPHTDYQDQPSTISTAKKAKQQGIIINTIQCGHLRETDKYWRAIAQYAGGEYFAIAQDGGTQTIVTPYDIELRKLSDELDKDYIPYGSLKEQKASRERAASVKGAMASAPEEAVADRAINKSLNSYSYSTNDLVQSVENGTVKLADITADQLPVNMQKMTVEAREQYIKEKIAQRKAVRAQIMAVSKQRAAYIKANAPTQSKSSFDTAVAKALRKQIK